jgi:pimeloyl-ACP methyl ester carboxylesterase
MARRDDICHGGVVDPSSEPVSLGTDGAPERLGDWMRQTSTVRFPADSGTFHAGFGSAETSSSKGIAMRKSRTAVAASAAALITSTALGAPSAVASTAVEVGDSASTGLARFWDQPISWHTCRLDPQDELGGQLDALDVQCAEVVVPLDYRQVSGRTITVAISRLKATVPSKRRGVLLTNPGGPGGPGLAMPVLSAVSGLDTRYDTIGMDPRFVGRSTPLDCAWPTALSWNGAGPDRRGFQRSVDAAKDLAARCTRTSKDVLPFASTRNTARDLDVVRAALGEQKVSYYGGSYGSYLGAVYLQMFPQRADRFVLDSALDPDVYGPALLRPNNPAMTAALRNWAGWTARHHRKYGLGRTAGRVLASVNRIRRTTDRYPLKVGRYRVDSSQLPILLWATTDQNDAYADLAAGVRILRDAARGAKVTPTPALEEALRAFGSPEPGGEFGSAQMAILCADRAVSRNPQTYWRDLQAHRAAEPLFGPFIRNITPCAFWPSDPVEPPTAVGNAAPVLILNATGDTQTIYSGALALHRALTGSRLVTLKNAFQHGVYFGGSRCADSVVNRYLLDGHLPARDVTCTRDASTGTAGGRGGSGVLHWSTTGLGR